MLVVGEIILSCVMSVLWVKTRALALVDMLGPTPTIFLTPLPLTAPFRKPRSPPRACPPLRPARKLLPPPSLSSPPISAVKKKEKEGQISQIEVKPHPQDHWSKQGDRGRESLVATTVSDSFLICIVYFSTSNERCSFLGELSEVATDSEI